jgi:hypothetical protein
VTKPTRKVKPYPQTPPDEYLPDPQEAASDLASFLIVVGIVAAIGILTYFLVKAIT